MDLCSASDTTDSKKRCGEWVDTEQPSFDAKHHQCKQSKVEIQARDGSDIYRPVPKPYVSDAKQVQIQVVF